MKAKELDIYTLAEGPAFWAVICNYLGWAPRCTYGYDILKERKRDAEAERMDILARVKGMGVTLKVEHLFEPFQEPELPYCVRRHYKDAFSLIHLLTKSGVKVIWDEIPDAERNTLLLYSPPLYSRLFTEKKDKIVITGPYYLDRKDLHSFYDASRDPNREDVVDAFEQGKTD